MDENNKYIAFKRFDDDTKLSLLNMMSQKMGSTFRILTHNYEISLSAVIDIIKDSDYWKCWEYMSPHDMIGKSGGETARELAEYAGYMSYANRDDVAVDSAYWVGWFLTHAMYMGGLSFFDIFDYVDISEIEQMYVAYHEMSVTTGIEELKRRITNKKNM